MGRTSRTGRGSPYGARTSRQPDCPRPSPMLPACRAWRACSRRRFRVPSSRHARGAWRARHRDTGPGSAASSSRPDTRARADRRHRRGASGTPPCPEVCGAPRDHRLSRFQSQPLLSPRVCVAVGPNTVHAQPPVDIASRGCRFERTTAADRPISPDLHEPSTPSPSSHAAISVPCRRAAGCGSGGEGPEKASSVPSP